MTKLSPRKYVGQMMGIWFLATSVGNLIAGLVGGNVDPEKLDQMPGLFIGTTVALVAAAILLAALTPVYQEVNTQRRQTDRRVTRCSIVHTFTLRQHCFCRLASPLFRQQKLLTIDDIFDPAKRVNFNGTTPTVRWLKDGNHYLLTNEASRRDVPRLQKVNAATGEAVPFFDAAKMQAAFAALPGVSAENARQLANRGNYNLNPAETAVLINWSNDLFLLRVWQRPRNPADEQS